MITAIGIFGFIFLVAAIAMLLIKEMKHYKNLGLGLLVLGSAMFCFSVLLDKVGAQEVGILITPSGVRDETYPSGWYIVAPWNSMELMDKTVWVYTFSNKKHEGNQSSEDAIWAPTKDGIKMGLDLSINWRIDPDKATWIYKNISGGDDGGSSAVESRYHWVEHNLIRPKTKSALALTVSEYSPIEVYSVKRQNIQDEMERKLKKELQKYNIILENVDMREVFYNPEYERAINQKKLAEQEAMRLTEVTKQKEEQLKQSRIEKDMVIQQAQGEAEALRIKGGAIISNPAIIQLEKIKKWDGVLPKYILGSNSQTMMMLPND